MKAVIVVDVQGDFTEFKNGSLAVGGTDETYIKEVEKETKKLKDLGFLIFATQDWHPKNHISFNIWPPHCIQGTEGSLVLVDWKLINTTIAKGSNSKYDSYSGFKDDGGHETGLDELLKERNVNELIIYGIATDYCVKATALDAVKLGYKVTVIESLCRGVSPDTIQKALDEMKSKGVTIIDNL